MKRSSALGLVTLCVAGTAFGAHHLQTEDTGTQGTGGIELENGFSSTHSSGSRVVQYQPQLSYGVSPTLDVIVQPSWLAVRGEEGARTRGRGDTNVDLKWRFFRDAKVSLALRTGATLPTAQHEAGLPQGKASAHLLLATTLDLRPFMVHGNLGFTRNPRIDGQRQDVPRASAAFLWRTRERLTLTVDAVSEANADPSRRTWAKTMLAGAIYTVTPSLELDIGYQSSVRADVPARQWLAGITYRFTR